MMSKSVQCKMNIETTTDKAVSHGAASTKYVCVQSQTCLVVMPIHAVSWRCTMRQMRLDLFRGSYLTLEGVGPLGKLSSTVAKAARIEYPR